MEGFTEKRLIGVMYFCLTCILVNLFLRNLSDPWLILAFAGLFTLSLTVRKAVLQQYKSGKSHGSSIGMFAFLVMLELTAVSVIVALDYSRSATLLYLIVIGDVTVSTGLRAGIWTCLGGVVGSTLATLFSTQGAQLGAKLGAQLGVQLGRESGAQLGGKVGEQFGAQLAGTLGERLLELPYELLAAGFLIGIMSVIKHQLEQGLKLKSTMHALRLKERELQRMNLQLKRNAEELEEMTIVKERNRIAREIHDTVGHTLTTVLVELEAGERLVPTDPLQAVEKLRLSKEQVRKGLNDIRSSVRMLQSGRELVSFEEALRLLIEETAQHAQVNIRYGTFVLPKLNEEQKKTIYRALQEGLTNGIRHGGSTAFVFQLYQDKAGVRFILQDNGTGCTSVEPGFGLLSMEERVVELGGVMELITEPGEGFAINISLPIKEDL